MRAVKNKAYSPSNSRVASRASVLNTVGKATMALDTEGEFEWQGAGKRQRTDVASSAAFRVLKEGYLNVNSNVDMGQLDAGRSALRKSFSRVSLFMRAGVGVTSCVFSISVCVLLQPACARAHVRVCT